MAQVRHISVGADGTVWCADDLNRLWRRSGSSWVKDESAISHLVSVGDAKHIWCVNKQGEAFQLDSQGKWQKDNVAKDVRTLSAAADGTVWCGNGQGRLFRREDSTWKEDPVAVAVLVAVGSKDQVWCVNKQGEAFQLDSQGKWQKDTIARDVKTLSVGADGAVWCGNSQGKLFRGEGSTWQADLVAIATVVAVGSKTHVWCANKQGEVFQRNSQGNWQKVDPPKGSWSYKIKRNDGLYEIVRQQFHITDENEVQRIAGIIASQNNIRVMDQIKEGDPLKLSY
jgi:hypothetical protein